MNTTMNIGVGVKIFVAHCIKHAQRLLCSSRIVEIYERTIVDSARKDGEVAADFIYIIHIIK